MYRKNNRKSSRLIRLRLVRSRRTPTINCGTHPSVQAVADALAKLEASPKWRGERAEGSGRLRATSASLDKMVVREVFKKRGVKCVTVSYLKKKLVGLRKPSHVTVANRLRDAGLEYMRRRRKSIVTKQYLQDYIFNEKIHLCI